MTRILTITIFALMLAGCAGSYDRSAMPKAAADLQLATVDCQIRWTEKQLKTYSEWQACQLAAERSFAQAISLTKMEAFETYATDMQALAAERDAHRVTGRQVMSRAKEIQGRFLADCGCKPDRARLGGYAGNAYGQDWAGASTSFDPSPRGRELSGT